MQLKSGTVAAFRICTVVQASEAPAMMELFTVMLGFDVDLTLPMLQQYIAESKGDPAASSSQRE